MDIDTILNSTKELLPEFTGSSTVGPSGQQPQIERPDNRLFKKPLEREEPDPFEVHGMKTIQELPKLEKEGVKEDISRKIRVGSLVTIDGHAAVVSEVHADQSWITVKADADGEQIKFAAEIIPN